MTNEERAVCLFQQIKDTIEWKNRIVHGDGHIVGYIVEARDPKNLWRWNFYLSSEDGIISVFGDENAYCRWSSPAIIGRFISGEKQDPSYFLEKLFGKRGRVLSEETSERIAETVHREYGIDREKVRRCVLNCLETGIRSEEGMAFALHVEFGFRIEPFEIEFVRDWTIKQYLAVMVLSCVPSTINKRPAKRMGNAER